MPFISKDPIAFGTEAPGCAVGAFGQAKRRRLFGKLTKKAAALVRCTGPRLPRPGLCARLTRAMAVCCVSRWFLNQVSPPQCSRPWATGREGAKAEQGWQLVPHSAPSREAWKLLSPSSPQNFSGCAGSRGSLPSPLQSFSPLWSQASPFRSSQVPAGPGAFNESLLGISQPCQTDV